MVWLGSVKRIPVNESSIKFELHLDFRSLYTSMVPILKSDCVIQYSRKLFPMNHIQRMSEELNENNKVKQF